MANKVVYAVYEDPEVLKSAARKLVTAGVKVRDVFSPFPIHGIDPIIGVKRTRLGIAAFMYGITGTSLALLGFWYFMIHDWPMNIGGKPNMTLYQNLPAFVPVMFEFTVFCAAHGMALTYLIRNKTLPGMPARNPDPRSTDDKFIIEVRTEDNAQGGDAIVELLRGTEALEINERQY
ncbi:MAG: DUF3341 domain-containing protein [Flavobacteriales bacterium]|jgi:hypothetical protein|nr:DUF3341 domain-containing protein [Flavobacteriales bacterium]MBK7269688.1 DUF3341 domain-containing protein [Flavobacteriales bacterium]MBK7754457.1 DUF3341 domain-containing protein [Flavobacteriales bacterium]MBK9076806.1 DUF3341 domain-containing protein [Flavobacteriales bacterium]MBK9538219.1 DUF3341 domain-containing protein [Flavobacteriales bacterium]